MRGGWRFLLRFLAGVLGTILIVVTLQNKAFSAPSPIVYYSLDINNTDYGYVTIGGTKYEPQKWYVSTSSMPSGDIVAHANTGYRFSKWQIYAQIEGTDYVLISNEGDCSTYEYYSATIQSSNRKGHAYTCYFEKIGFTVTTASSNTAQGTVSGGGTVEEGQSTTITATSNRGFAFDCWKDSNGTVVATEASYTFTPTEDITLTAYFKVAYVTIHKGDTTISDFIQVYDDTNLTLKVVISPNAGEYISEISFDNSVFYAIESWKAELYGACANALSVTYSVTSGTNKFGMFFDYVYATPSIDIYVRTTNQAYTSLKKPSAGGVSSVAVTATLGGTVTLVGDDYESLTESDTIICSATPCVQGYTFAGWYLSSDMTKPISTNLSVRLAKSTIYGQELIAKFEKISTSNNINSETNNTTDIL